MADSDKTQQGNFYVQLDKAKRATASLEARAKAAFREAKEARLSEATALVSEAKAREAEAAAREAEAAARGANCSYFYATAGQLLTGAVLVWTLLTAGR